MKAKCLCNLCSGEIEFEQSFAGQAVVCPNCEAETILYVQPNQSTVVRNQIIQPDEIILSRGHISVTRTRLVIGSSTYTIAAISSLHIVSIPVNKLPLLLSILSVVVSPIFAALFFLIFDPDSHGDSKGAHFLAGAFCFVSILSVIFFAMRMKPNFGLCINTSAGEHQIMLSSTIESLLPIEAAILQAISMRA